VLGSPKSAVVIVEIISLDKENISEDANSEGMISVNKARLYDLVSFGEPVNGVAQHTFDEPVVQIFTFIYGS